MDIRNKEILITGGAGFIGSNLVHRLYKDNHVYVMDDLQTGSMSNLNDILPDIDFIKDRVENINNYCLDVDYIFHIGIYSSSPMYRNNPLLIGNAINDMIKILELAKKNKSKIVYASTSSIYNEIKPPHSENVIPKVTDYYTEARIAMERVAELYDKLYGMDVSAMRFFSIYGYHEKSKKSLQTWYHSFYGIYMTIYSPYFTAMGSREGTLCLSMMLLMP